jgi:hypothetical protein
MKDPRRILDEEAGGFASELLRSAKADAPSDAARAATRAALGIENDAVIPSSSSALLPKTALIAGGIAISAALVFFATRPIRSEVVELPPPPAVEVVEEPAPVEAQTPQLEAPVVQRQAVAKRPKRAREPSSTLRDEIVLIEGAKLALQRGDAGAAEELLKEHERKFAGGVLSIEAEALRIEAYIAGGDKDRARILLEAFQAAHPESALLERLRVLVAE